ncbi:MAG: vanadium-dependent haloperoxidase, partial [Acidobacteriaceae bacterium]|nr:vanadium-dependent haloperoxidase [Acidobacteriaceae bacterium]
AAQALGVTPAQVFRGPTPGDMDGPYVSQFLLRPIPYGSGKIDQRYRVPETGSDFMTTFGEWSQIQIGMPPWREGRYLSTPRYILNGRDLAEFVHYDYSFQAYVNAALILFDNGPHTILNCNPFRSFNNPYRNSRIQDGFVTFGQAEVMDWIGRVTTAALKAAYCQKWMVHRRLRPEELGGLIHQTKLGTRIYAVHADCLRSPALEVTHGHTGSYLLPQAYPEGCPLHPSYPAGHAAIAGACSVVLKACFEESMLLPGSVIPTLDGVSLKPLADFAPTLGAEINKLAFNVAMGRDWAGIHYRSDAVAGLRLGEDVAISILQDLACTYTEVFKGFSFTRFDGIRVHISTQGEVITA